MPYTQFSARDLEKKFGIQYKADHLFPQNTPISPSDWLKEALERAQRMGFTSEKSRSERLVSPVLTELCAMNNNQFTLYSGLNLDVDDNKGLNGECDFILSFSKIQDFVKAPIFTVVEAKKNDIESGTTQCAAQLIAAQLLNKEENPEFDQPIYGCSTTGTEWRFLSIYNQWITIDLNRYYIQQIEQLLGVLQTILQQAKEKPTA